MGREEFLRLGIHPEKIAAEFEQFKKNITFYDENKKKISRKFPEMWIGVSNQSVVGTARDLSDLITKLENKGIDPSATYIQFATRKKFPLVLASKAA